MAGKKKSAPSGKKKSSSAPGQRHVYILVIMVLVAALLIVINRQVVPVKEEEKGESVGAFLNRKKQELAQFLRDDKIPVSTPRARESDLKKVDGEGEPVTTGSEKNKTPQQDKAPTDGSSGTHQNQVDVKLYYLRFDEKTEKTSLVAVKRQVNSDSLLGETMRLLLEGPSGQEKNRGILSAFPPSARIRSVRIRERTAWIDFNEAIGEGGGADLLLGRLDQIIHTATQFDDIDSVQITINGKRRKTLGGEGLPIEAPLKKR